MFSQYLSYYFELFLFFKKSKRGFALVQKKRKKKGKGKERNERKKAGGDGDMKRNSGGLMPHLAF